MEASQAGAPVSGEQEGRDALTPEQAQQQSEQDVERQSSAAPTAADELPAGDSEERNPAVDQAPAATEAQDAIIGDPGLRDEQEPASSATTADIPHRTSAPPPNAQSGVPLPEDRAAGVEPGPKGPIPPVAQQGDEAEVPEHDASGGQSATSPLG